MERDQIIKELMIAGRPFSVEYCDLTPADCLGKAHVAQQRILIEAGLGYHARRATILHEILEVIDSLYELNLDHRVISALESALYQVLQDNELWRDDW